jgi:hypothetical protein
VKFLLPRVYHLIYLTNLHEAYIAQGFNIQAWVDVWITFDSQKVNDNSLLVATLAKAIN